MRQALTLLATLTLVLGACDQDASPSPAFLSGMGMSTMGTSAGSGYGLDSENEAIYGASPSNASTGDQLDDWIDIPQGPPIAVSQGHLGGNYGYIEVTEGSQAEIEGYSDGFWTEVNLLVDTPSGVSMAIFEVWGGLESLESGSMRTYDRFGEGSVNSAYVSVIGCAGPLRYEWDYDTPASEVVVSVSDLPDKPEVRLYEFTARFEDLRETWMGSELVRTELKGRFEGPARSTGAQFNFR